MNRDILYKKDSSANLKEKRVLYSLAKSCPKETVIVEIGSWKGLSTIVLAKGAQKGNKNKIYAVDPHTGSPEHHKKLGAVWTFDEFKKNIKKAKVQKDIFPIVKTSEEAEKEWGDKPIGLLFIDGDHSYKMALNDFLLWEKYLVHGGVIAFHDTIAGGAKKVVNQVLYNGKKFTKIKMISSLTLAKKIYKLSILEKILNRVHLIKKEFILFIRKLFYLSKGVRY